MSTPQPPEPLRDDPAAPVPLLRNRARDAWIAHDRAWVTRINRASEIRWLLWPLAIASRLGDGIAWYALLIALPFVGGDLGKLAATQMFACATISLAAYLWLKRWAARPRPAAVCPGVRVCARALDQFSFPSGHTLHSVAFTLILTHHFPAAGYALWPLTTLIAISRVALGLHYPSDVAAGAVMGVVFASLAKGWVTG